MDIVELYGDILQPGGQLETPGLVYTKKLSQYLFQQGRVRPIQSRGNSSVPYFEHSLVASFQPDLQVKGYMKIL